MCPHVCITVFDQMFLTWFYLEGNACVMWRDSCVALLQLCAGVPGARHSKVPSFFGLKSPLVQMWALSNYAFYHFWHAV